MLEGLLAVLEEDILNCTKQFLRFRKYENCLYYLPSLNATLLLQKITILLLIVLDMNLMQTIQPTLLFKTSM